MRNDSASWVWLVLIALAGVLFYKGVFYQTGAQWHETCWYASHSTKGPQTPDDAAAWNQCDVAARKAFYDSGLIFSPHNSGQIYTKPIAEVDQACPSGRNVNLTNDAIEKIVSKGGPSFADKFLPATWTLKNIYEEFWPTCSSVRLTNRFPKMVEQKNGWYDWQVACEPCEAERKAAEIAANQGRFTLLPDTADQQQASSPALQGVPPPAR